ncbi:CbiX/SirB N-terminal domain-containing protein [Saccharibacillus sp. CPCC 101409]|uniref:sirohydrochlorin chelatase n=1 Tax=Saccharibacillus sp. CPCC 101409 TaxID=3058041 RepID=UPI002671AEDF|nr:CbiX/SirB N-terminal domain-containing protein [Saccharibacillus sp. CPCC 101409]MDO3412575.1 CbiX/SirB N-terminal domain-containing protein [Saccharibacillus sp. CPCC 101409]
MRAGALIISHGSPQPEWVAAVEEAAGEVRIKEEMPVAVSFLGNVEGASIQDGIDALEAEGVTDILAVMLFVSEGSTHIDEIHYALGAKPEPDKETDLEPFRIRARVHVGRAMGDDEDVARMVWDKIAPASKNPEREMVLLIGHGSVHDGFRERWEDGARKLAKRVGEVSGLACDFALLNPDGLKQTARRWIEDGYTVLAAPIFLSTGYFLQTVIPRKLQGLSYEYTGQALLPHPLLPVWIERQIEGLLDGLGGKRD